MKILVAHPLEPRLIRAGLGESVIYRPELETALEGELSRALTAHAPDALLVRGSGPRPAVLEAWQSRASGEVQVIRRGKENDLEALAQAERGYWSRFAARRLASHGVSPEASGSLAGERVVLVGAGIVNLMTALALVDRGAKVEILEASPDPRCRPPWQLLGTTHGGDNARMFCYTEADNYNEKGHLVYAKMHQVFRQRITEGGWLAVDPESLSRRERAWIERFHAVPGWRAEVFMEDIHRFTMASEPRWEELRRGRPGLFEEVGYSPGILRLYAEGEKAQAAEALHARLGSLTRSLDTAELVRRHPACREAVEGGQVARALEVKGFTLNIHAFVAKLLAHLESRGVRFVWDRPVEALDFSPEGRVRGLRTAAEPVLADHFVLSPGAFGGRLLRGTRSDGKIQGILGLWLSLPHIEPRLAHSIKLHREGHVGEDSNVTLASDREGRPLLVLGSGYGFLGERPLDMKSPQIQRLFEALEETSRRYFPKAFSAALREGLNLSSRKACLRPFTSTGLGILEICGTSGGGRMVLAAGHNTGGFAQAPAVAEAVVASLEGRPHSMQALYDPERGVRTHAPKEPGRKEIGQPFLSTPGNALEGLEISTEMKSSTNPSRPLCIGLTLNRRDRGYAPALEEQYTSRRTRDGVFEALTGLGAEVLEIEADQDLLPRLQELAPALDLVFNLAEGLPHCRSRQVSVPAALDHLGVPWVGSSVEGHLLAANKMLARRILGDRVAQPAWWYLEEGEDPASQAIAFPALVKPIREGFSVGIDESSVVHSREELEAALERWRKRRGGPVLVESFLGGVEYSVGVLGEVVLPPVAWDLSQMPGQPKVRGEDLKSSDLTIPHAAWVEDEALAASLAAQAVAAHRGLGLEGYSRSDFRAPRGAGRPCFLEVNSMPGLEDEQSVLPWAAGQAGIPYRDVIGSLVALSLHRLPASRRSGQSAEGFKEAYRRLRARAAFSRSLPTAQGEYRLLEPRVLEAC